MLPVVLEGNSPDDMFRWLLHTCGIASKEYYVTELAKVSSPHIASAVLTNCTIDRLQHNKCKASVSVHVLQVLQRPATTDASAKIDVL